MRAGKRKHMQIMDLPAYVKPETPSLFFKFDAEYAKLPIEKLQ